MSESNSSGGHSVIGFTYWLANVAYAFKFWGFGWGLFNLVIPSAAVWDLVMKFGELIN